MKVCGVPITQKSILLPLVLTFALFIIVSGMRPIQLQKINKPRVHARDVVQSQEKVFQSSVDQSDQSIQAVEPNHRAELVKSPTYRVSVFPFAERNSNAAATLYISSRAPPVSLV
jgi:hypothetical protein